MITFKNVNKTWPNGVSSLKNINLEIKDGEFVGVIGLSGAGKTTLIKTINKMNDITSGQISVFWDNKEFDIKKLKGKKLRDYRKNIALISQDYNNISTQSVFRNTLNSRITTFSGIRKVFPFFNKKDQQLALEALENLGILDKAFIRAENLSGGQQQRVALARAICQQPKIIIADEPVSALDPVFANQVMEDFVKINQENNISIIMNIHHVELALKYATRIIGIKAGEIIYDGPSKAVNENILKRIYGEDFKNE